MPSRNIAIVWDFDGTLTPNDSTSELVDYFLGRGHRQEFWRKIKKINGSRSKIDWERILASDAPTWMYVLSRIAFRERKPLTSEFFKEISHLVNLYTGVEKCLKRLKNLSETPAYKIRNLDIHHFIVTAGLKEYVEQLVPMQLFSGVWGCRYEGVYSTGYEDEVESIPVFCMDESMKTRALFEISKGVFIGKAKAVNERVNKNKLWCPFENIIYIGDGPTDVPALALTRTRGGYGIVVYNPRKPKVEIKRRLSKMSADSRCDLITEAKFSFSSELFKSLEKRCHQILQKYDAEDFAKQ